ncbi:hypothetical protein TIFTF001_056004, partial [Ficus carica]
MTWGARLPDTGGKLGEIQILGGGSSFLRLSSPAGGSELRLGENMAMEKTTQGRGSAMEETTSGGGGMERTRLPPFIEFR